MSDYLRELSAKIGLEVDTSGLDQFNHKLEGMHRSLEIVAGAEIIKGLFEIAEKFSGMGEQLETASAQAGITAERFQALSFAAAQSGIGQEKLGMSLSQLSRQLEAAREGSDGAAETFGKIGISPEQLASFANSEEALKAVADRIQAIQDPIKRTQTAMKLFGRGGASMVRFLGQGAEGINEDMKKAADLGAVISSQQVESLAELEDSLSAFGAVIKAAFATLATYAAPIIRAVVDDLEQLWAANRAIIDTNVEKWFEQLAYAVGFTVGIIKGLVKDVRLFIDTFPNLSSAMATVAKDLVLFSAAWSAGGLIFGPFKDAFGVVLGLLKSGKGVFDIATSFSGSFFAVLGKGKDILAELVFGLGGLIGKTFPLLGAAFERLGLAMVATPIGLIVAGVTALVVAGHDLWTLWQGGDFWKDTWLGQAMGAVLKYGGQISRWFTGKADPTGTSDASQAERDREAQQAADTRASNQATANSYNDEALARRGGVPNLAPRLTNLAGANNPLYDVAAANQAVSFQNTFNIQAPVGGDAQQLASMIRTQFDQSHTQMMQQAKDVLQKPRVM